MPKLSSQRARIASGAICTLAGLIIDASTAHAQLAPIWTGFYAGVQGGKSWAELNTAAGSLDTNNAVWGLHGGFNLANGQFVIGVEGDVNFNGADFYISDALGSASAETDWSGSLRVRVGMTLGPALVYGTFGYAHLESGFKLTPSGGETFAGDETLTGVVYGLGAEGFVLPNVTVRLEALQYDYSMDNDQLQPFIDLNETVVRAGLTYHFN